MADREPLIQNVQDNMKYAIRNLSDRRLEIPMPAYPDNYPKEKRLRHTDLRLGPKIDADAKVVGAPPCQVIVTGEVLKMYESSNVFRALVAHREIDAIPAGSSGVLVLR